MNDLHIMSAAPSLEGGRPHIARWAIGVIAFALIAAVSWAAYAKVDQVTRAPMQIISEARTQSIQAPDGGVITGLYVREGEEVKAGQLLVTLDQDRAEAAVADSEAKVAALRITLARLEAEVYGRGLVIPEELSAYGYLIRSQRDLFAKRQAALHDDLSALQNLLALSRQELRMNQQLEATGDVSRAEILRLQRSVADLEAQIVTRRNKYFQDAQAEMTKAQEELNTAVELLNDRNSVLRQTRIYAPRDSVVNNIRFTTLGAVVRQGDVICELAPLDAQLVAEVKVNPSDISNVREGMPVSLKLDAYDYAIFGSVAGNVTYVSPDILTEQTPDGSASYYRVHVAVDRREVSPEIQFRPGLAGLAEIKARSRSVLSFLTKPVTKTLGSAFGEK